MECSISGEIAKEPVVTKSGHVYEKTLLESYIKEKGEDPATGEAISWEDDVIVLEKGGGASVHPKQPVLTSIPSLLSSLQTEWDSLILETFSLKQQLLRTRQELSTALYINDAAVRVAARLTKERDEARSELAKLSASLGIDRSNGEMEVDGKEEEEADGEEVGRGGDEEVNSLPVDIINKITQKSKELAKIRKANSKQELPEDYSSREKVENYKESYKSKQLFTTVSHLDINEDDEILTGGGKSLAGVFSIKDKSLIGETFHSSGIISDVSWNNKSFILATKNGSIDVFDDINSSQSTKSIVVSAKNVLLNVFSLPLGSIVIANDKTHWYIVDLESESILSKVDNQHNITSLAIHPDGELVAVGGDDGNVRIYKITEENFAAPAAVFNTLESLESTASNQAVGSLSFSENGYWLASCNNNSIVQIWNLRKLSLVTSIVFSSSPSITSVKFDGYSQHIAVSSSNGIEIASYNKSEKSWNTTLTIPTSGIIDIGWGNKAKSLASITSKGNIYIYE